MRAEWLTTRSRAGRVAHDEVVRRRVDPLAADGLAVLAAFAARFDIGDLVEMCARVRHGLLPARFVKATLPIGSIARPDGLARSAGALGPASGHGPRHSHAWSNRRHLD